MGFWGDLPGTCVCIRLVGSAVTSDTVSHARQAFDEIDTANSGSISKAELQAYLTKKSLTLERAEEVFDKVDKDNSEQINYLEFVAATVPAW